MDALPPLRRLRFMNDFDNGGAIAEEEVDEGATTLGVVARSRNGFVAGFPAIILVACCCCKGCFDMSDTKFYRSPRLE